MSRAARARLVSGGEKRSLSGEDGGAGERKSERLVAGLSQQRFDGRRRNRGRVPARRRALPRRLRSRTAAEPAERSLVQPRKMTQLATRRKRPVRITMLATRQKIDAGPDYTGNSEDGVNSKNAKTRLTQSEALLEGMRTRRDRKLELPAETARVIMLPHQSETPSRRAGESLRRGSRWRKNKWQVFLRDFGSNGKCDTGYGATESLRPRPSGPESKEITTERERFSGTAIT